MPIKLGNRILDSELGNKLGCIMFDPFWFVWCKIAVAEVGVSHGGSTY